MIDGAHLHHYFIIHWYALQLQSYSELIRGSVTSQISEKHFCKYNTTK